MRVGPVIALGLVATYAVLLPAATLSSSSDGMPVTTSIASVQPASGHWQNHPAPRATSRHGAHLGKHA